MLERFLEQLRAEAFDHAHEYEEGQIRLPAIAETLFGRLEEAGIRPEGHVAFYRCDLPNKIGEVHGYAYDVEDDVLTLFYVIDANESESLEGAWTHRRVGKDTVGRGFRRLQGFVRLALADRVVNLDESQPARELVELVKELSAGPGAVELHVLATGQVSERSAHFEEKDGLRREVWDLLRLARTCDTYSDRLTVDFLEEFGASLPCLVTPRSDDGVQVFLSCMPGSVLASLYNTYRGRLLERNVRSFLQLTGKVNKGIRTTILDNPSRFLPYNNGISATASSVELEATNGGLGWIKALHDFQVVNGGQTTATLASCVRRDEANVEPVSVAMKLTVMSPAVTDTLVPLISRFANTQNRIQEADFYANDPWHVGLERMSRQTWTAATPETPRGTRWYYERSRGQYADELNSQTTPAGRRVFKKENPTARKFSKTDLAKYVVSWDQRPAIVSRGAQKCFMHFMAEISRTKKRPPAEDEFVSIVGQAILFKTAERLYGALGFQGYRAQVVTYSIAKLSFAMARQMPWPTVWANQEIPEEVVDPLKTTIRGVREAIIHPPSNKNITEWCKRDECWSKVVSLDLGLKVVAQSTPEPRVDRPAPSEADRPVVEAVRGVPGEVWYAIAKWAKETDSLQRWQRGLSYSLGNICTRSQEPSVKQAIQARKLLMAAVEQGFRHDELASETRARLESSRD